MFKLIPINILYFLTNCKLLYYYYLFYRNRLENNTEHWNTLLLSLRELVEWVIKKDTEILSFGPLGSDLATLQKQQVYT